MPNVVMEYSDSIEERVNVQALLEDLHHATIDSGLFQAMDVKSRTLRPHNWLIGDKADTVDFIHVTVELLSGRTVEQKQALSQAIMAALRGKADFVAILTVNIRDMDRECFQKVVNF
ncbi:MULTISPECIES: 5-carboxymethyl-2-hydroxymuconate Delta-isomerase [Vibrio]|uniref:5-carboxymethyl-2-hydroxymuconate isomerase n=1 Tax=Vibrio algicola TaxID=2662262 RepID=A0A5Q0TDE3_9VIBR|nr:MULTISPECIES: 5-carboxymethyl-2-hydroxymuconate Delta-isomerase [Vibrio]MBD1575745.1 5-carboxymethyl-2-hydroxymuconate Delta-isomerase [Vibrio sp. S11_S32]